MNDFLTNLRGVIASITPNDALDIFVVAFLIYECIKLIRDTHTGQLFKGFFALVLLYVTALALELKTLSFLMQSVFQIGAIAILVVFQPELRRALDQLGRAQFPTSWARLSASDDDDPAAVWRHAIEIVSDTAADFSAQKTGALIVLERKEALDKHAKNSTLIDAAPSSFLMKNIFFNKSPLHDGALILRDGRFYKAGCVLPVSQSERLNPLLGTRHRAAVGITEVSDAVAIVVSEETGAISVAVGGTIRTGFSRVSLSEELISLIVPSKGEEHGAIRSLVSKTFGTFLPHRESAQESSPKEAAK